jgi:hypothetical protein
MQNKANWKIDPMTVTNELTRYYNRMDTWCRGKNKAKTKPNKANLLCPAPTWLMRGSLKIK